MSKWIYQGQYLEEPPKNTYGYVYKITNKRTKEYYIGMKCFWSFRNSVISKKRSIEIYSGKGPRKKKEKTVKESDWKAYCSSSTHMKAVIQELGVDAFCWDILEIYTNKTELQLGEAKEIIDCICDPKNKNEWLKLTIYKKNLECNK